MSFTIYEYYHCSHFRGIRRSMGDVFPTTESITAFWRLYLSPMVRVCPRTVQCVWRVFAEWAGYTYWTNFEPSLALPEEWAAAAALRLTGATSLCGLCCRDCGVAGSLAPRRFNETDSTSGVVGCWRGIRRRDAAWGTRPSTVRGRLLLRCVIMPMRSIRISIRIDYADLLLRCDIMLWWNWSSSTLCICVNIVLISNIFLIVWNGCFVDTSINFDLILLFKCY